MVLAGVVAAPAAMACDLCSIYAASRAQGGGDTGLFGGVAEQFNRFGTLRDGGHVIQGNGEFINSSVSQIFAGYNINSRASLQLNVPIIYRSFGSATSGRQSESGVGDISLIGSYVAYEKLSEDFTFNWTVLGGIKFPTGNPNRLGDEDFADGIGGHDLALGSGSVDGIVGTGVFTRWKRMFFTGTVQYAIRSEGSFEHRYANDLTWSGGPGVYLALKHSYTLSLQAMVSGETKGKDTFSGVDDGDSAETIVYLGPQLGFTWKDKLGIAAGVDLPVSIYNSGVQVVSDYRVHAAVTWRF
ncbi:MAG: hypothetical protein JWR26_1319 [Pedosphaera sp.]|nr:hypothetical protein [Pedosphaera sp.]